MIKRWMQALFGASLLCLASSAPKPVAMAEGFEFPLNPGAGEKPDPNGVLYLKRPKLLAAARASGTPVPEIVLQVSNPWLMVIGSDSPSFALYSDGTAIYATKEGYRTARLTPEEHRELLEVARTVNKPALTGGYHMTLATDQPDNTLLLYLDTEPVFIRINGNLKQQNIRSALPPAVDAAFARLSAFSHPRSSPWLPERVEVMVWPYEHARNPSVRWPDEWPGLKDCRTVQRGELFSLFLDSKEVPRLRTFLEELPESSPVEIDGRKWSVGTRIPFPHEDLWMGRNAEMSRAE